MGGFHRTQPRARIDNRERRIVQRAIGVGFGFGFLVDGVLGRGLGAIARIERVVERLAIVVCGDSRLRALNRLLCGVEFFARITVGAGRARFVDGLLCLLEFFGWGIVAAACDQR